MQGLTELPRLLTTHGDHNFAVPSAKDGSLEYHFQDQVIDSVVAQISATGKNNGDLQLNGGDRKP